MNKPIDGQDAYPEQIATEFVRITRNSEQEWKNRALAAELNLACEKREAREVIGQLQKELDAARAQAQRWREALDYSVSEWRKLKEAAQKTSMFSLMFGCEDVLQRIEAQRDTEKKP